MEQKKLSKLQRISFLIKLLFSLFLFVLPQLLSSQNQIVSLSSNLTIKEAFNEIERQTKLSIDYENGIIDLNKRIQVPLKGKRLSEALTIILSGSKCNYTIGNNHVLIVVNPATKTSVITNEKITGYVLDSQNEPIIGANIRVTNSQLGTVTDINGKFSLDLSSNASILISYIGFIPQEIEVLGKKVLNVILLEKDKHLNELVVIGYGSRAKRDITTAISTVSSKNIEKSMSMTPELAMQGQMSGIQVIGNQGDPYSRPTLRIRGTNTWGVSDPLYVVDGIPITEFGAGVEGLSSDGKYVRGNINIMSMIDPTDIESISVLKDAAAAAIYGVRAANGVVLITTKKGKRGEKTTIEYSTKIGVSNQMRHIDVMDTKGYANYFYKFFSSNDIPYSVNAGIDGPLFDPNNLSQPGDLPNEQRYLGNNPTYDWQRAGNNKNAMTQDQSVRISGGTDKTDYSVSFGYTKQEGVSLYNNLERYSGAFKLNSEINKYIRTGVNVRMSYGSGNNQSGSIGTLKDRAIVPPWQPIYDSNGLNGFAGVVYGLNPTTNMWDAGKKFGSLTRNNGYGQNAFGFNNNNSMRTMGNAFVEIEPLKNLKLKGTISLDNYTNNVVDFNQYAASVFAYNGADPTSQPVGSVGTYGERNMSNNNLVSEFTANYSLSKSNHNIDLLFNVMAQTYGSKYQQPSTTYVTTTNSDLIGLGGDNVYTSVGSSLTRNTLTGMLVRMGYNYDHKYYLDATIRRDGSSRFAPENRYGVFPGLSVAWRINQENIIKDLTWLDDLKFRASWGQLGNQEVANNAYLSPMSGNSHYTWGNDPSNIGWGYRNPGATVSSIANRDLTWEKTTTSNVGFDFAFFKGLSGSIEYYYKMTDGILQTVSLPLSAGVLIQPVGNIAAVSNKGIELNLNYANKIGELNFSVSGNFTTVKNNVEKMYGAISNLASGLEVGKPMFYIRGYELGGMFQNSTEATNFMQNYTDITWSGKEQDISGGDFWFKDMGSKPTTTADIARGYSTTKDNIIDSYDQTMIGKTIPGYYYGINLSLDYTGFDFSAQFTGVGDVQRVNSIKQQFLNTSAVSLNQLTEINNAWTPSNTNSKIPRIIYGDPAGNSRFSNYWVEDADYIRLSNIQLGYTLSQSIYKLTKNILRSARIYVGCSNLFTLTKYTGLDPEDDNFPAPLIIYSGLNISF